MKTRRAAWLAALLLVSLVPADAWAGKKADQILKLIKQLKSHDAEERTSAAWDIGEAVEPDAVPAVKDALAQAVPALALALKDKEPAVRANAAASLGRIGSPAADSAVPALREALADREGAVRINAVNSL